MRWSFRIFRVGETEVRIHLTMLLFVGWYAWGAWQANGAAGAISEVAFIVLLFLSVLLHEFGHIFAARRYKIATPEVLLTPIGGIARIARMPEKPRQELVVALAGPAVTLAIVLVLGGAMAATGNPPDLYPRLLGEAPLPLMLFWTNGFLLVFNLIPAFPMDGGRVLRALLAGRLGIVRGTQIAVRIGQALALGFGVVGLRGNPILLLIAAFVFLGAEAEYEAVKTRQLGASLTADSLTVTDVRSLPPSCRLDDAIRLLIQSDQRAFPVVDSEGHLLGTLTRDDLLRGVSAYGLNAGVSQAMAPPSSERVIPRGMPFELAIQRLFSSGREALPVVDEEGRFVGLMTRDNVTDVLMVQRLRERGMKV